MRCFQANFTPNVRKAGVKATVQSRMQKSKWRLADLEHNRGDRQSSPSKFTTGSPSPQHGSSAADSMEMSFSSFSSPQHGSPADISMESSNTSVNDGELSPRDMGPPEYSNQATTPQSGHAPATLT